jgi:hypothetical protein
MAPTDPDIRRELLSILDTLHRHKDAAYGDAWRQRGEVIAIFANMARKYDRLLVAFDEQRPAATEPLADTVADLCVYAAKYLTWIADEHPHDVTAAHLPLPATVDVSAARGADAVSVVFAAVADKSAATRESSGELWRAVQYTFTALERALMAQATRDAPADDLLDYPAKATLAWTLTVQSAALLVALQREDPALLDDFVAQVAAMEQR